MKRGTSPTQRCFGIFPTTRLMDRLFLTTQGTPLVVPIFLLVFFGTLTNRTKIVVKQKSKSGSLALPPSIFKESDFTWRKTDQWSAVQFKTPKTLLTT